MSDTLGQIGSSLVLVLYDDLKKFAINGFSHWLDYWKFLECKVYF